MINRDETSVAKSLARVDFDKISFILFFSIYQRREFNVLSQFIASVGKKCSVQGGKKQSLDNWWWTIVSLSPITQSNCHLLPHSAPTSQHE